MKPIKMSIVAVVALACIGTAFLVWSERSTATAVRSAEKDQPVRALTWTDLLPDDTIAFRPLDAASDFPEIASSPAKPWNRDELTSGRPNATPILQYYNAPRADLAGQRIALGGYMTPLMVENGRTRSFLLVPYVGACIHVPAPPPNQVILVETQDPIEVLPMWRPFTAVGTLRVETIDTGLATVGYTMALDRIDPYEESQGRLEGTRSIGDGD